MVALGGEQQTVFGEVWSYRITLGTDEPSIFRAWSRPGCPSSRLSSHTAERRNVRRIAFRRRWDRRERCGSQKRRNRRLRPQRVSALGSSFLYGGSRRLGLELSAGELATSGRRQRGQLEPSALRLPREWQPWWRSPRQTRHPALNRMCLSSTWTVTGTLSPPTSPGPRMPNSWHLSDGRCHGRRSRS